MRLISLSVFILPLFLVLQSGQGNAATISGRMLMKNGLPLSGGVAVAFDLQSDVIPAPGKYFRVPDFIAEIQNDGNFSLDMPPGEYAIGGVKRTDGRAGPPRDGDVFFLLKDEKQNLKHFIVTKEESMKLGDLAEGEVFRQFSDPVELLTGITGRVLDRQGKPVSDVIVAAVFEKQSEKTNIFIAHETDSNGVFFLPLPSGGKYSLGVWDSGGPQSASKLFRKSLQVETGVILQGIDLIH